MAKRKIQIKRIKKRDGQVVAFSQAKITRAIMGAFKAAGAGDRKEAEKLSDVVVTELEKRFNGTIIPEVEQVQDLIETEMEKRGLDEALRAFTLYRELHRKLRGVSSLVDSDELIEKYLNRSDWRVKENANMTYSLQGLNNHVSSIITANYWMNKIYSREMRKAHRTGDIHIHDLSSLSAYCTGWDFRDFLIRGFGGVSGKVNSKPPKHLSSALGQLVNFFYTLQGEVAGAVAMSNFDTYLAPFIRHDKLNYEEVKQLMQEFLFNMNVPTRVGFQCFSEDTEILGVDGWRRHDEVKVGDTIKTFNVKTGEIEEKKVKKIFARKYKGEMYRLKNRIQDQLISPKHRVVRRKFGGGFVLEPIEEVLELKSSFMVPVVFGNGDNLVGLSDKEIMIEETEFKKVEKVDYEGVIWCPNTENETVIARRKGKVFVSGNTPFTNISMDLVPTKTVAEESVIIGGKPIDAKYGDYQKEIDIINRVFAEVMMEGDAQGRVFTFPIPTYSITKDFDWDNKNLEPIWEMTRKYGVPYFSNFINSEMDPEDARSMCPLAGTEKVLVKSGRGRGLEYSMIRNVYEGRGREKNVYEIYANGRFVKGGFGKYENQKMIRVELVNGHKISMSEEHLNFVLTGKKEEVIKGRDLNNNMYLPYSLNKYEGSGGGYDLGFFVGAFAGDGSFDQDTAVVFSLENNFKKSLVTKLKKIAETYFSAHTSERQDPKTKLYTLKIHSRAAVGLCKDFVADKERNKRYRARLFDTSLDFRQGVIDGHYVTDGGNRHRIYTSSVRMVESLNMLASTMGTTTAVYKDDREGRLGVEPNYSVLIYQLNRKQYGKFWRKHNGKLWVKIKKIEKIGGKTAYCFEVKNDEPMFTVGTTGILTHNCRLRLDNKVLRKRGGLFAANPLTGSIGVVTINLPRIGYEAAKDRKSMEGAKGRFFAILGERMDLAKESLVVKRKELESLTERNLYPYCSFYLSDIYKRNGVYWRNHFNTIGINGMNEALINLMGKTIAEPEGKDFALEVMDYMRDKILIYQKELGEMFNLEATPAEGTAYRFARLDKQKYPNIKTAGEKVPYYTNSTHLPVNETDDLFEALDHQDDLQCKYTGGTVMHGFLGESLPTAEMTKKLVRKVAENYKLPYFSVTPTFSICPKHGYIKGEWEYCPKCDKEIGYK